MSRLHYWICQCVAVDGSQDEHVGILRGELSCTGIRYAGAAALARRLNEAVDRVEITEAKRIPEGCDFGSNKSDEERGLLDVAVLRKRYHLPPTNESILYAIDYGLYMCNTKRELPTEGRSTGEGGPTSD